MSKAYLSNFSTHSEKPLILSSDFLLTLLDPKNLTVKRMMKYSSEARATKMMLIKIHIMRGQMFSDFGMVMDTELVVGGIE